MLFAAGPVEAAGTDKMLGVEVPEERRVTVGYGCLADVMVALEYAESGSDYITGDRFTAADIYVGSHIGWGMQFGTLEKRPAFQCYWDRISDRPAAVRAREIDDALLPPQTE